MYRIQSGAEKQNSSGIDQTKQQLINFIYKVNLSQFKYDTVTVESDLPQLISKTYHVSANFSGSNCLLVFAKIKEKFHIFLVDRKTLSFNPQKVNPQNVKITTINLKIKDMDIYKGTILDGTFVQNKNDKIFIITDVYMFKGQDYSKSQLDSKLFMVRTFLDFNYEVSDKNNTLEVTVNKIYPLEETEHVINNVIPKIKHFLIKGICFYPEISGTKLLFKFGNENVTPVEIQPTTFQPVNNTGNIYDNQNYATNKKRNFVKDENSDSGGSTKFFVPKAPEIKKITKTLYIPKKGEDESNYVFEMQGTDKADVYKLMILDTVIKDGKKLLKRVQACLAFIPNMTRSKWCKDVISKTEGNVLVNCTYHPDKHKWEPVVIAKSTKPSFVESFDTKIVG